MAFGGFETSQDAPMAEMNVIPLVDIMLVLLVIFIITAPVITHSVKVEMPQASSEPTPSNEQALQLSIHADQQIFLDDTALSLPELEAKLRELAARNPEQEIHLQADRNATYDLVARSMAAAQRAGIVRIGFVTQAENSINE